MDSRSPNCSFLDSLPYFPRHLAFLFSLFLFQCPQLFSEGTKQLKPDSALVCQLDCGTGITGFPCFATPGCDPDHKLYVRISNSSEKVYLGFSQIWTYPLNFRITLNGVVVFGPFSITPGAGIPGYIQYYSQAFAGPNVLNIRGYMPIVFHPGTPGDYSIEFDPVYLEKIDVTVIDTLIIPKAAIDGRLWAKDWCITTGSLGPDGAFNATQYVLSDDSVVTSIYYNGMLGHHFDVTSTRNGCYPPPMPWDSSCRSRTGNHHYAQYKIFLNNPDSLEFPTGTLGAILPGTTSVTTSCDGSLTAIFSVNKPGLAKMIIDVNPVPGIQPEDVTIIDSVTAGVNTIIWTGTNGLGILVPDGTIVSITLSYINGLTNLALYDIEKNLNGFIIGLVRPPGNSIATYWNDTLLANKGGVRQLAGCYNSLPATGCHIWDGNYVGVGLGSMNTVNTWWYASSDSTFLGLFEVQRFISDPQGIDGPVSLCGNDSGIYTVIPQPLTGADPQGFEWILTDVASGLVLFDSAGIGAQIMIPFSSFPPGVKQLKVRASNENCGFTPYIPGGEGLLIAVLESPSVTNQERTFSICTGGTATILFQCSSASSTVEYFATATSLLVTGYSGGIANPLIQTLFNNGMETDSVIYKVVPSNFTCQGDTANFVVRVSPVAGVTNTLTTFELCSGENTSITLTSNFPSADFTWTATASSPSISGYFSSSGTLIAQTLTNPGQNPGTVEYTVSADMGGCFGPPKLFSVTVNPGGTVSVTVAASANPVCSGTPVTYTATPVNGGSNPSYHWKVNGINAGTNSSSFTYVPVNNDSVRCIITSNLSCVTGNPASSAMIIMVGSLVTNVAFSACFDTVTTVNAKPFKLRGGLPLGGIYSGPGVNSSTGYFTPSIAGTGVKTISYSYLNVYDCSASKSKSILVQPVQVFSCGNNLTDTRDNKVYPTVQIGTQCWMASNLNYGNAISSSLVQYDNCISEKYCYNNLTANCNQYGGLYQWDELMNYTDTPAGQGVCPPGWHVPTESDWTILFNYYQGNSRAGRPLQDTIINGFKALTSGVFYLNSSWSFLNFATILWSSTSSGQSKAISHGMNFYNFSASLYPASRGNAFPVRCLRD